MLESMAPGLTHAALPSAKSLPRRMAFVYLPNGMNMADWTPKNVGTDFDLPATLQPLQPFQKDMLVLSGLTHDKGRANGDGAGDHARASASYLTACQPRKTQGADIRVGVSVDQVAGAKLGQYTRLPSLELGCDHGKQAGNCDSGYSCAYSFNISWKTESTPMPTEVDPRLVFDRLFGNGHKGEVVENRAKRDLYQKSILDFVMEDANRLQGKLGATDKRKLDEYLTAVRELETRIERAQKFAAAMPDYNQPTGIPKEYEPHLRLMYDLMALAFQTDTTRISTFIAAHDGSNRQYPFIGVSDGHHDLSHHQNDPVKKEKIAKINLFHTTQFAYFLQRLKSIKEGDGTLLDQCMIVYGSGLGDGNAHNHDDLPVLLAGRGGGTVNPGRHVRYEPNTPMADLFLSMLDRMEAPVARIGDSKGKLASLS